MCACSLRMPGTSNTALLHLGLMLFLLSFTQFLPALHALQLLAAINLEHTDVAYPITHSLRQQLRMMARKELPRIFWNILAIPLCNNSHTISFSNYLKSHLPAENKLNYSIWKFVKFCIC